jgi:hypothetical protein
MRGHVLPDEFVRATLAGRLSALVVPMRPQPTARRVGLQTVWMWGGTSDRSAWTIACPLGQPSDRVWCREAHAQIDGGVLYRATHTGPRPDGGWRCAVQMQGPDSRLTFEIVANRCEQLQQSASTIAAALGFASVDELRAFWDRTSSGSKSRAPRDGESWNENPWVHVATVRRVSE